MWRRHRGDAARQDPSTGQEVAGCGSTQPGVDQDCDRELRRRYALECAGDGKVVGIRFRFPGKVDHDTPASLGLYPIVDSHAIRKLYALDF